MKSVTMSEVVRAPDRARFLFPIQSIAEFVKLGLVLASGLVAIMYAVHLLNPAAPLAYIVIPALVGGLLPVFATMPGRFEVRTRFDAQHLVGALDTTLEALGYTLAATDATTVRYRVRTPAWLGARRQEIVITLRDRRIEIVGPMATLRRLQRHIAV